MLVKGKLVVKLPRDRVDALVDLRDGERFDAGMGKPIREWFALSPTSTRQWRLWPEKRWSSSAESPNPS